MHARRGALAAVLLLAPASALAFTPHGRALAEWTITPDAGLTAPPRANPTYDFNRALRPAAWQRFTTAAPGRWSALWDHATAVPHRIYGTGVAVPGALASAAIAEQYARTFLADHLDLLAPGAAASDFVLVADHTDGDIRSIGFYQYKHGLRVVGGQIGFEFKRDRLFVIHSEALPDVQVPAFAPMDAAPLAEKARVATIADEQLAGARAGTPAAPVILPLVADDRVLAYRVVAPVDVDAGANGRWTVYADASSGAPVARHQELMYSTADVQYDAVVRWEGRPRQDDPAQRMHAMVDGAAQTTDEDGDVTWSDSSSASLTATTVGDLVQVVNATGATQTFPTTIAPGGSVVWSMATDPNLDAEINAFVHVQIVNAYVRVIDPTLDYLNLQIVANVDLQQTCNAFYTDNTVNFFSAGDGCANTGTIADVIYHEFEHGVHQHEIIPGVGEFDGSLSEGQSDFIAASITGDSGMGRGFHDNDQPLRELDPPNYEWKWPEDTGEIHQQGLIFSGAMWDLRKRFIAEYGQDAGVTLTNQLFLGAIRRSSTIPDTIVEVLATDDDNGDLSDGTPHECDILAAFGPHGLRPWTATTSQPGAMVATPGQTSVTIDTVLDGLSTQCPTDQITSIQLAWLPRSGSTPQAGSIPMSNGADQSRWYADLPLPGDGGIVNYQVQIAFADGSTKTLPDNLVDHFYNLYQGPTVPLLCTDFETDPFTQGWTHTSSGSHDDWMWGVPVADNSGDPGTAWSGTHIVGTTIGGDGLYSPNANESLDAPTIDVGKYSDIHLQYRRHLAVQDGQNDQATISVNGLAAWQNPAQPAADGRQWHYVDSEWVWDDVPLSGFITSGTKVSVAWGLVSDGGYQLGGWNIDDACIVANANVFCGDGIKQPTEQCDNGAANANAPNACRTDCRLPTCGDGIVDTGEQCDDGNKVDGDGCSSKCTLEPKPSGGCCDAGGAPGGGSIALALFAGSLLLRRRRGARSGL